jgi:hypothetical protein
MTEEPESPYVDLPRLIAKNRDFMTRIIVGGATIGMVGFVAILAFFGAVPNNVWGLALLCLSTLLCFAVVFYSVFTFSNLFEPVDGFDCPHQKCEKYIAADDPWICGHCDSLNTPERPEKGTKGSSFAHWLTQYCCKCSYQPSSYLCHHCGEMIFLDEERDGQHPARAADKKYPAAEKVDAPDDWKAQIERMVTEKMAFSTITQKVCELRDAELKRIEADQNIDRPTKSQLIEFEKQWANKKLQEIKMRVVKSK